MISCNNGKELLFLYLRGRNTVSGLQSGWAAKPQTAINYCFHCSLIKSCILLGCNYFN